MRVGKDQYQTVGNRERVQTEQKLIGLHGYAMENQVIIEVESDPEESGYFEISPSESGQETNDSPPLTAPRENTPQHIDTETQQDVYPKLLHDSLRGKNNEKVNKSTRPVDFDIEDHVGQNAAFLDIQEEYLKVRCKEKLYSNAQICEELVCRFHLCQDLLHKNLNLSVLFGKLVKRVRSYEDVEESELKTHIKRADLTEEMKSFLSDLSQRSLDMLMKTKLLHEYVEMNAKKECTAENQGDELRLYVTTQMLSLSNKPSPWIHEELKPPEDPDDPEDFPYLKVSSYSTRTQVRENLKTHQNWSKAAALNTDGEKAISILTFISLRDSVPAKYVFMQYLLRIMDENLRTYLLVYHIGPLVDEWSMVLYQYRGDLSSKICSDTFFSSNENSNSTTEVNTSNTEEDPIVINDVVESQSFERLKSDESKNTPTCRSFENTFYNEDAEEDGKAFDVIVEEEIAKELLDGNNSKLENKHKKYPSKIGNNSSMSTSQINDFTDAGLNSAISSQFHEEKNNFTDGTDQENSNAQTPSQFLSFQTIHKHWESHEGKLVYNLTEISQCLRYNIKSVPRIKKKSHKHQRNTLQK